MKENPEDHFLIELNQNIRIVHRICHIYFRDQDQREDMFQEIMYQLWKSYSTFKGESKFSTWMYRVALNTSISHLRKAKRKPPTERLTDEYRHIGENPDAFQSGESMDLLYAAINTLSDLDKAIIFLYLEENNYDEIAAVTGLTKTNVSVRIFRIKKTLEQKLKSKQ